MMTTNKNLAASFRELRAAWFDLRIKMSPHPRSWEDSSFDEANRELMNRLRRENYDEQTELIIQGDSRPLVAPTCGADLVLNP